MASSSINDDHIRRLIREAMHRLIDGCPIRSDGKLTIKSLAAEADVKRWVLTHKHQDLQSEFHDRVQSSGSTPKALIMLTASNEKLKDEVAQLREKMRDLSEENHRMMRIIQVLTLENQNLREKTRRHESKVTHLR